LYDYFRGVQSILEKRNIRHLTYGHAGDGTVHIRPFLDLKSTATYSWLPALCDEIYTLTLSLKGTIGGEHGDGYLRSPFIKKQYGNLFNAFKEIKNIFDTNNIFNPDNKTGCDNFDAWRTKLRFGGNYKLNNIYPVKFAKQIFNWGYLILLRAGKYCNLCIKKPPGRKAQGCFF